MQNASATEHFQSVIRAERQPTVLELLRDAIIAAHDRSTLDGLASKLWGLNVCGDIGDLEAQQTHELIEARRRDIAARPQKNVERKAALAASRLLPRTKFRPTSPDRQASRERRRALGGSAPMPYSLSKLFTEGQRAVLAIIAGEVKHHGVCTLFIDKIAALAGVCRTTVQTAVHEARRRGLIEWRERRQPGRLNLTNVIRITASAWIAWLNRGPTAHRPGRPNIGSRISARRSKILSPTNITNSEVRGCRGENRRASCQSHPPERWRSA